MSSPEVSEVSADEARERLEAESAIFVDVRDAGSYRRGHIPGAAHIGDHNVEQFVRETDKETPVIVYCFHGNSSIGGAAYLQENGFTEVYSMAGGFADWGSRPTATLLEPQSPRRRLSESDAPSPPSPASKTRSETPRHRGKGLRNIANAIVRRLRNS